MGTPRLEYGALMDKALRQVIVHSVAQVAEHGLPDGHSFYISFPTTDEGVEIPDWLRDEYPDSISIVLQHEYYNLTVDEDSFAVDLTFRDRPAHLRVPFRAITIFADPKAQFGLRFKSLTALEEPPETEVLEQADDESVVEERTDSVESNVIPFDVFRRGEPERTS